MSTSTTNTPHEQRSRQEDEEHQALEEVDEILNRNRPRHLVDGIASGIGFVLAGAVGACGILVLSPHVAGETGAGEAGAAGRVVGGLVGAAVGVYSAVSVAAAGVVSGVGQVVRGLVNTPGSLVEPRRGKWWNVYEGKWVQTHLKSEKEWIETVSEYDEDILGRDVLPDDVKLESDLNDSTRQRADQFGVKDVQLYDLLGVDPDASEEDIHRRFAQLAKKFNPNRAGANSAPARIKLQEISEAYVILANPQSRATYDKKGRAAMNGGQGRSTSANAPLVDPLKMYATLYGSEKLAPYIGRLAAASDAVLDADRSKKMTLVEARQLQKRRVTRLALVLADRLQPHVKGDAEEAKEAWKREAAHLCDSNHGTELVRLIGASYASCAAQFLGSLESGIGMPSIARWARKQRISLERTAEQTAKKVEAFAVGNAKEAKLQDEANLLLLQDATDEEAFERIGKEMLAVMWTRTAVDVASTIHEVSQMVLFDQDLNPETRELRGHALEDLGQIFQTASCRRSDEDIQTQGDFERIAFYAVLETIRNQEMATRNASIVYVD